MSTSPIDPQNIPQFTGDLEQLGIDTMLLTADALTFRQSGSDAHTRFQGLSACYSAPEAEQLFATTVRVATKSDEFADDLEQVAAALGTYEAEVQPLVAKLKKPQTAGGDLPAADRRGRRLARGRGQRPAQQRPDTRRQRRFTGEVTEHLQGSSPSWSSSPGRYSGRSVARMVQGRNSAVGGHRT
ncbi:hypothetical protein SALBM217S_10274 [Streptomyces griseoloalbus]